MATAGATGGGACSGTESRDTLVVDWLQRVEMKKIVHCI